ncbi:DUF1643 domain-containing protein [Pokkaliibacter sp. CJK22405]|uniref:DUF1643 domain-containing protein n=1 Tax=Pokkaliibacter sp. CJK22405 TaxID=3384615 RepID=UPI003984D7AF
MSAFEYKEYVAKSDIQIDSISSAEPKFRYSLRIPFKREGTEVALVVMMNPSKADRDNSDRTVNNVLKRIYKECVSVKEVVIVNLYPIYETYSSKLALHEEQGGINISKIYSLIPEANFALLGWGKPNKFSDKKLKNIKYFDFAKNILIKLIDKKIPAYKVGHCVENLYPRHLGRASFATGMSEVNLNELVEGLNGKLLSIV